MLLFSAAMKTISLAQLLSSCLDANRQGCEIIQNFYKNGANNTNDGKRTVDGKLKIGGDARSVVTQADVDAQATIIGGLRASWGDELCVIGEEDEADAPPVVNAVKLKLDLMEGTPVEDEEIPINELALFVDPLDGTREFVEGRVNNVACLIGIARNSRPIAGVVGLPFPDGSTEKEVVVHYAVADQEASASWSSPTTKTTTTSDDSPSGITILTGDSKDPILVNAIASAKSLVEGDPAHEIVGGTAAKLRRVATEPNYIAILHFKTELWDTCAPQALLDCKGGKITDLFGSPLVHNPGRTFGNIFGVVASSGEPEVDKLHDELCAKMRADIPAVRKVFEKWMGDTVPSGPQAMDVARDLEGIPISVSSIQEKLSSQFKTEGATLKSYSVPEAGAWRGMMSNGGRINLNWKQDDSGDVVIDGLPSSVFYKRIVMADLAHARDKLTAAPHKLVRDVKSYQVETSFLTSQACQEGLVKEAGVRINKVFGADLRPAAEGTSAKEQLESRFSVFLQDFNAEDGWEQQWLLDEEGTKAALAEFAKMHAYFWEGSQFWKKEGGKWGDELKEAVWKNGGYMQPALQGYDQLELVAKGWEKRYPTFKDDLAKIELLEGADLPSLGANLQEIARLVGDDAHPFYDDSFDSSKFQKYRTLIHGDPKQANIFFQKESGKDGVRVGLIDFQWCGFGLAATDVAHHISAAVDPSCVSYDGEKEKGLLDHYYSCLSKHLVEYGVATSTKHVEDEIYPRAVLQEQYETAVLDISRMVFAYAWRRWKAESEPTPESLNRNSYNKSLASALWLVTRCHVLLEKRRV